MHFKVLCVLFSISFLLACTSRYDDKTLLSIPVESTVSIVGEELEYYQDQLQQYKGTENIRLAIFHVWGEKYSDAKKTASFVEKHKKSDHTLYDIIYIFDSVPDDDSSSGYRYRIQIQDNNGAFDIIKLEESWRCWPDRGHQYFDTEPCK